MAPDVCLMPAIGDAESPRERLDEIMSTALLKEPWASKAIIDSRHTHGLVTDYYCAFFEAIIGGVPSGIWKVEAEG